MCFLSCWLVSTMYPTLSAAEDVTIHGFVSQGYLKSTDNNYLAETEDGTFEFNEMGINFSTDLTDSIRIGAQFFARDLGPEGNDEVRLDWAYGDYRIKDFFGIRVGRLKYVHGLYNTVRELDMARTSILLPQSVYVETWRDTISSIKGAAVYGDVTVPHIGSFQYIAQAGALSLNEDTGLAVPFEQVFSPYNYSITDMDADTCYTGGLEWQPVFTEGLRFKGTYYKLRNLNFKGNAVVPANAFGPGAPSVAAPTILESKINKCDGYVLSTEFMRGALTMAGEYTAGNFQGDLRFHGITGWFPKDNTENQGWYVAGSYRFSELFEWGLGYSNYYPNKNDKDGDLKVAEGQPDYMAWQKDIFTSFRFDLTPQTVFKLEVHKMNGFGAYSAAQDPSVVPEEDWYLFASKVSFSF